MPILNYTTTIEADKTIGEIHGLLRRHRVVSIETRYDPATGDPVGLLFQITTPLGPARYLMPARVDRVQNTLLKQSRAGQVTAKGAMREQAVRVAWRIVRDWAAVQMAMVEADAASMEEIMLPYRVVEAGDGEAEQTVYDAYVRQRKALPSARGDAP